MLFPPQSHTKPHSIKPHRGIILPKATTEEVRFCSYLHWEEGMGSSEAQSSSPPVWSAAIHELIKGRESAGRLAALLLTDTSQNCRSEKLLLEEIMDKISTAITVLESDRSQVSLSPHASNGPGGKRPIRSTRKAANRKREHPYSWATVTCATTEDGHTWRKYGQKDIFSTKHPRSYYRCTHKHDRGCNATRQVQKSEDEPSLYVITYFGEHTCKAAAKDTPCLISYQSNAGSANKSEIPFSSYPSDKQEGEEEVLSNLATSDSPSDYFVSPEVELQRRSESSSGLHCPITSYNNLEFMILEDILSFDHNDLIFQ